MIAVVGFLVLRPKPPWAGLIAMPDAYFSDLPGVIGEHQVSAWGAMRGENISRNNHITVECRKDDGTCRTASFEQIGDDQVSRIEFDDYRIIRWTPDLIQAVDDDLCSKVTMNVSRVAKHISFVREPTNATDPICEKADTHITKWEIGRPAFWEKLDSAKRAAG